MASLIGETVDYSIEFDTETSDENDNPTGYPTPILVSGSFVVGNSQEVSQTVSYTYTGGGFSQTFAGTATIDLSASALTVGFSGTAQAFDLKFTLSNLAQGSVQAVTGVTQTGSSGVQSGVNSEMSPTFTNTSVTTGFNFFGYQPGTTITQTDQLTFGAGSPEISSSTYDASTGQLVVSGSDFTTSPGDYSIAGLTLTGEDDSAYRLSSGSVIAGTPTSTSFTVNLSTADQLAVDGLLNQNGTASTGNDVFATGSTTFGISGDTTFDTGAAASNGGVTVSNARTPTLTSVFYDNQTGILTLNGSGFENDGNYGGINLGQITLEGGDDQTFTFNAADYASVNSTTQATVDLSNTASGLTSQSVMSGEEASVNALFDQDGSSSEEGTTYNVAATSGWDSGAGAAIDAQSVVVNCYCRGTLILTPAGEVPVETLTIGDLVTTLGGKAKPVRWMGTSTVSTRFADPLRALPIRIAAGALAEGVPSRDLFLSPDHAVLIDHALIQAGALVNGSTITRQTDVPERFAYYHVELAEHAILIADGTPAESFVDNTDRLGFDNWMEHQALYGEEGSIPELPHPRAKSHRQVPMAIRARLAARAAGRLTSVKAA